MKRSTLLLVAIVATLIVFYADSPVRADGAKASMPNVAAVVTLKDFDFDFFTTVDNPVGLAVDPWGDVKVGILGLATFTELGLPDPDKPRPSTPVLTVTPEGRVSDFVSLPLATDLQDCRDARPGRDFVVPGELLQEPTPFSTGFAYHRSGDLYVGLPNCDPDTHGIWRIKPDGTAKPFVQMPLSQLPKGLAFSKNGSFPLYVTDLHDFTHSRDADPDLRPDVPNCRDMDCTLKIWRIDRDGTVTDWKESTLLYGDVDSPLLHPHGVNGIALDKAGENVYVTITDHGRVIRIPIKRDGSAGDEVVIFESPLEPPLEEGGTPLNQGLPRYWGMDGITVGPDGNLYIVIVRTDELVVLPPDGSSIQVLHQGHPLDGPTQLVFGPDHDVHHRRKQNSLLPLYITNGAGRRVFFVNGARFFGEGDLLAGIGLLVGFSAISELDAVDLQPRPSLVRVLLGEGKKDK